MRERRLRADERVVHLQRAWVLSVQPLRRRVIGAPQIPKATIALPGGRTLSVVAKNLSKENMFVKSATFNGKPVDKTISHADIMAGGELVFEMGR